MAESAYVRSYAPPPPDGPAPRDPQGDAGNYQHVVGRRWFAGQSVYLADEYLLCVNGGTFQETYRRFYYRDIQAILLRRTGGTVVESLLLILVLVLAFILAASVPDSIWLWLAAIMPVVMILVWTLLSEGRCVCYIQTPVSIQRLPVTTFRAAKKLLAELSPRIEAVQGPSSPADLQRILAENQPRGETPP
ncbi:MAG: hypothetical protein FWE88_09255 [Phycisphaerae bacterium]|nr:hypothetical protein [Phycisphaerae bacterium]